MKVTVLCGWQAADPVQAALSIAAATPEIVEILEIHLDVGEADLAGMLHGLADFGAAHALVVASPDMPPVHVSHLVQDALMIPVTGGPHRLEMNGICAVVDLSEFLEALETPVDIADVLSLAYDDDRTVAELIIDQIEYADVILLRGSEHHEPDKVDQVRALLHALNPMASVETCFICGLDPSGLLHPQHAFNASSPREPAWISLLEGRSAVPASTRGVSIVIWHDQRPLDPLRFRDLIEGGFDGLVRARGFFWLASRPNLIGSLNACGSSVAIEATGCWWASTSPDEWPADPVERARIRSDWDPVLGDRCNELVFIGLDMDEAAIRFSLDACVVNDVATVLAGTTLFVDPLVEWNDGTLDGIQVIRDWGPPYPIKCN